MLNPIEPIQSTWTSSLPGTVAFIFPFPVCLASPVRFVVEYESRHEPKPVDMRAIEEAGASQAGPKCGPGVNDLVTWKECGE